MKNPRITHYLLSFDSDRILASQWSATPDLSGEQKLCLAILECATKEYLAYSHLSHRRARNISASCREWFFSDDTTWPFSFINVCQYLHIQPDYIRAGIQRKLDSLSLPMPVNFRRTYGRRFLNS